MKRKRPAPLTLEYRDPEWLREQYEGKGLTTYEIASVCGVDNSAISRWMGRAGIQSRYAIIPQQLRNPAWLQEEYLIKGRTAMNIAQEYDISDASVRRWLREAGIKARNLSETNHAARGNHVTITPQLQEFLDGMLLSDGHMENRPPFSARYSQAAKHRKVLEYIATELARYGVEQCGKISKRKPRDRILNGVAFHDEGSWSFTTRQYAEFKSIRERWYPDGKKRVPADLPMTPIVALWWYLGDGSHGKNQGSLCTGGFPEEDQRVLICKLGKHGIRATLQKNRQQWFLSLPKSQFSAFLDFIGPCPHELEDVMAYKFTELYERGVNG